jgi:peroxiredoxin
MIRLTKFILYFVFIAFCSACKREIKVVMPNDLSVEIEQYIQKQHHIVMIYVDSSNCTPCSFKHLAQWYSAKDEFERNGIGILLIFRNSDEKTVTRTLRSIGTFYFIFDKGGTFKAINKVFKYAKDNIFVIDKGKNVIMTKSPLQDEKTWNYFIKLVGK